LSKFYRTKIRKEGEKMSNKLYKLTITMFLMSVLANLAHPVTPELVVSLNMSSYMYGFMFAAMSVASFTMSPFWGNLSDKHRDRKKFIYLPMVAYGLAQLGFGYSTESWMIVFFRVIAGGFACSTFTNAIAYIVDETTEADRSASLSFYTAIGGLGVAIGFLIGGYVGVNDYHYSFILQSVGLIALAIFTHFYLPKSCVADIELNVEINSKKQRQFTQIATDFKAYLPTALGTILIVTLLVSFSNTAYSTGVNYFLKKYLHFNPLQVGYYMALTGIVGLVANLVVTPRLSHKFGDEKAFRIVVISTGITLFLLALQKDLFAPFSLVLFAVFIFMISMYRPLIQTLISKLSKNEHGKIMGLQQSLRSAGMVGGSLYAGLVLDINPKATFILAGIVFVIAGLVCIYSKKMKLEKALIGNKTYEKKEKARTHSRKF
jgi:DHA1 family multidrug resistance protein-like MFS transporter